MMCQEISSAISNAIWLTFEQLGNFFQNVIYF